MISAGARDEAADEDGMAHFIEHTVFKGTRRRKSENIFQVMESVGGDINAYTTRDTTCFYTGSLTRYARRALDLLGDITFEPTFPSAELEKEKNVILEEVDMYKDIADETIYDEWHALMFKGHALSHNILGAPESIQAMNAEGVGRFMKKRYTPETMVLATVGSMTLNEIGKLANIYIGHALPAAPQPTAREMPGPAEAFDITLTRDYSQAHCVLGGRAWGKNDAKQIVISLINTILTGAGMSARLNMSLREKHGLTYNVSSSYLNFEDSGSFSIYFGCDDKNTDKCRALVEAELLRLCTRPLSATALRMAKNQLKGQLAYVMESAGAQMMRMARMTLDYGRVYTFKEMAARVDAITANDVAEAANELLHPSLLSALTFRPPGKKKGKNTD